MRNDSPKEYEEAVVLADWLRIKGIKFSHLAQETFTRSWGTKMKNKRMGVNPGVPDFLVITPKGLCFIELKRIKGGVVSPEQREWIDSLNNLPGVEARVCKGAGEGISFIEELL